jgi:hypothetical protein
MSDKKFWWWRGYLDALLWERIQLHLEEALEYDEDLSEQQYEIQTIKVIRSSLHNTSSPMPP